jgi:hypothetical protein
VSKRYVSGKQGELAMNQAVYDQLEDAFAGAHHQFLISAQNCLTIPCQEEFSIPPLRRMPSEAREILGRDISWKQRGAL